MASSRVCAWPTASCAAPAASTAGAPGLPGAPTVCAGSGWVGGRAAGGRRRPVAGPACTLVRANASRSVAWLTFAVTVASAVGAYCCCSRCRVADDRRDPGLLRVDAARQLGQHLRQPRSQVAQLVEPVALGLELRGGVGAAGEDLVHHRALGRRRPPGCRRRPAAGSRRPRSAIRGPRRRPCGTARRRRGRTRIRRR